MRRPQAALAFVLWITCLAWIGGCASPGGPAPAAKGSPLPPHEAVITEIASTLTADAHVVTIQASSPLKYTAFRLSDPLRLVIDFVDAAFAPTVQDITLQQGAIHAIHPRFLRRERIARVEIDLRQDTPHKITQQAGKVTVTFSPLTMARAPSPRVPPRQPLPPVSPAAPPVKPTEEPKPEKPVQEVRPAEQPAPPLPHPPVPEPGPSPEAAPVQEPGLVAGTSPQVPVPPAPPPSTLSLGTFPPPAERKARTLEGLRVKKEPELTRVRLFADGKIGAYNVIKQDQPPQVLLSLPQMVNRLAAQEVPVQSPFLERIVIKEEEEPLLVFVLPPTAGYKVYREQNQLVLHFYTAPSPVSAPPLAEQVTPPPSPPAPSPVAPQKAAPPSPPAPSPVAPQKATPP
ncbi:MAG: AMIN domain-containing protein, partial [Nitrospinota bacterium]